MLGTYIIPRLSPFTFDDYIRLSSSDGLQPERSTMTNSDYLGKGYNLKILKSRKLLMTSAAVAVFDPSLCSSSSSSSAFAPLQRTTISRNGFPLPNLENIGMYRNDGECFVRVRSFFRLREFGLPDCSWALSLP